MVVVLLSEGYGGCLWCGVAWSLKEQWRQGLSPLRISTEFQSARTAQRVFLSKKSLSARLMQSLHLYWSSFAPRKARLGRSSQDLITAELPCRRCRLQLDVGQYSLQCRYSIAILSALQTDRKANQLVYKPSGRLANAPVLFRCCNRKIARGSPSNDWRALTLRLARKLANSERERASILLKSYTKIGVDKNVGAPSPGRFEKINIYKYVYTMRLPENFVHGNDVIK